MKNFIASLTVFFSVLVGYSDRVCAGETALPDFFYTSGTSPHADGDVMPEKEIECLLRGLGAKRGRDGHDPAAVTASSVFKASYAVAFEKGSFNRISMLQFLAQIQAESGAGVNLTQLGTHSLEHTGFADIQVTGAENLKKTSACMNKCDPGSGNGVCANPEATVGAHGDPYKSALISLCWWKLNIADVKFLSAFSESSNHLGCEKMTKIVNGSSEHAADRCKIFDKLKQMSDSGSCRQPKL